MDYLKFTPEYKDSVLKKLCDELEPYHLYHIDIKAFESDPQLLHTCLMQFQELGLIQQYSSGPISSVVLTADAIDFLRKGGFVFEETVLLQQLDKVILELEKLQSESGLKRYFGRIKGIMDVLANLMKAYTVVKEGM